MRGWGGGGGWWRNGEEKDGGRRGEFEIGWGAMNGKWGGLERKVQWEGEGRVGGGRKARRS